MGKQQPPLRGSTWTHASGPTSKQFTTQVLERPKGLLRIRFYTVDGYFAAPTIPLNELGSMASKQTSRGRPHDDNVEQCIKRRALSATLGYCYYAKTMMRTVVTYILSKLKSSTAPACGAPLVAALLTAPLDSS